MDHMAGQGLSLGGAHVGRVTSPMQGNPTPQPALSRWESECQLLLLSEGLGGWVAEILHGLASGL